MEPTQPSDAFITARDKWSSTDSTSAAADENGAGGSIAVTGTSPPTFLVGSEIGRMATAMERIADAMPGLINTLEKTEQTLCRIADSSALSIGVTSAHQSSAPVTNVHQSGAPVTNVHQSSAPVSSVHYSSAPVTSVYQSSAPLTSDHHSNTPALVNNAGQNTASSPHNSFDFGMDNVDTQEYAGDSDDDVDPFIKCAVCKGPSESDIVYVLDCGHWPFCDPCVQKMTKKAGAITYKFKCPTCVVPCLSPFILNLF